MRSLCHRNLRADDGSALVAAILAMLLLSVFALSIAVLADIEARLGLNQKAAQQALALAEAGLEHGRNMLGTPPLADDFKKYIESTSARQLGVPSAGITLGPGKYWVRVDNDCANPAGYVQQPGDPTFVPAAVEDDPGGGCSDTADPNETVVLTAWSEVADGAGRVIGRARLRAHYTIGNAWKHSCYDQDGELCIEDAVGGCNNNPCVDPSDPNHPNGPAVGELPLPEDIRCGNNPLNPKRIPETDIPGDVAPFFNADTPCVIYPYYQLALRQPALHRVWCPQVLATAYGDPDTTDPCKNHPLLPLELPGTLGWPSTLPVTGTCATWPQKCHGMVFFGPGNNLAMGAGPGTGPGNPGGGGITFAGIGTPQAWCMGNRNDGASLVCHDLPGEPNLTVVVYVMGKVRIGNNVEIHGTLVLHGDGPSGGDTDFDSTGTNRVTTRLCTGVPCGYPLAILAYNPNPPEVVPTPATGQTIALNIANPTGKVSGLIYSGGTVDFNPINVDGGIMAHDVNITNTATRIAYNPTYGNAAPPPGFPVMGGGGGGVQMFPATWVHCTYYANETGGPTPCE